MIHPRDGDGDVLRHRVPLDGLEWTCAGFLAQRRSVCLCQAHEDAVPEGAREHVAVHEASKAAEHGSGLDARVGWKDRVVEALRGRVQAWEPHARGIAPAYVSFPPRRTHRQGQVHLGAASSRR